MSTNRKFISKVAFDEILANYNISKADTAAHFLFRNAERYTDNLNDIARIASALTQRAAKLTEQIDASQHLSELEWLANDARDLPKYSGRNEMLISTIVETIHILESYVSDSSEERGAQLNKDLRSLIFGSSEA